METAISASNHRPAALGLYGGTFDPIHYGHLRLAEELAEYLDLAQVRFVPAARPPLRSGPQASAAQRLAMVERAIQGNSRFVADARELGRSGPSFTVDTLQEVRQEQGETTPICLFMGADAFLKLGEWHDWPRLFTLAHLVIAYRPGYDLATWTTRLAAPVLAAFERRRTQDPAELQQCPAGAVLTFAMTALDISATQLRDRLHAGRSVRYLVPDSVVDYIGIERLYR